MPDTERTVVERLEQDRARLSDMQQQLADAIPARCRGCLEANPDPEDGSVLDAYVTVAERRLAEERDAEDVAFEAVKAYRRSEWAAKYAALGICISGVTATEPIDCGEVDGEPLVLQGTQCGLSSKVKIDSPEFDVLCITYRQVWEMYNAYTENDDLSRELHSQLSTLEQQFPVEFDDIPQITAHLDIALRGKRLLQQRG